MGYRQQDRPEAGFARDLTQQPYRLTALKIVAGSGKDQLSGERSVMNLHAHAGRRLVVRERLARVLLDLRAEAVGGAERPMPNGSGQDSSKGACRK